MTTDVRTVLMTAPDEGEADRLTEAVIVEGLAACGTIVPGVRSIFRWKGEVERVEEVLVILKTSSANLDRLRERVVELHSYEVPEFLAFVVDEGHAPYLDWIGSTTGREQESE